MLDLGGGPGLHGIAIVAEHPSMRGVIFDRPSVAKGAEEFIADAMQRAGFSSEESELAETAMMPMELDIARK